MNTTYEGEPPLTEEQRSVVDQPWDALLLVTAGAGAGKTHTLVRRVERLIGEEELSARDTLVLSFSRAAVRELRNRIARHGEAARHVRAQTFDSWALELLTEVDANEDWQSKPFEERLKGAAAVIADGLADDRYMELQHIIIDEVQDLVGDRRDLVETLLERFNCGFTVVGDPAQAIYGFQIKNLEERKGETNRFIDWLRATFDDDLAELQLTENFRARTAEARTALPFGPTLRASAESGGYQTSNSHEELRTALLDTLILGNLDDEFVRYSLRSFDGTSAILCRTNGQALLVSEKLHDGGVPHRLQRLAEDRAAPAWIGTIFRAVPGSVLTRERFDGLVATLPIAQNTEPSVLWGLLMRVAAGSGRRSVDLGRLRAAIATGRLPDELTAQPQSQLIISSFHRAKGLEFDRVIVMDPGILRTDKETDPAEEARMLYVAMTRPRDELMRLATANTWNVRVDDRTRRWARYGKFAYQRMGLELFGTDVHPDEPAGAIEFTDDPRELQDYLATKVRTGDPIVLERLYEESLEAGQAPPYLVVHDGRAVGVASEGFRTALYRLLQQSRRFVPRNFPCRIDGIHIDAIETVAGSEAAGTVAGLGPHGIWLAPRLTGLSRFTYDKKVHGNA